jgi:VIT1/CCC1 family predicted Fe2+/Mn2+ transporter
MPSTHDDFEDNTPNKQTFIVKDERAALRMKKEETREAEAKYRAIVAREREAAKAAQQLRREEVKLELAKLRINQSASEKARTNLAITTPAMLILLIGGFICMLGMGTIPDDSISVASALLTLLVTGLMANLRSIISEGGPAVPEDNGNGNSPKPKTDPPKPPPKS